MNLLNKVFIPIRRCDNTQLFMLWKESLHPPVELESEVLFPLYSCRNCMCVRTAELGLMQQLWSPVFLISLPARQPSNKRLRLIISLTLCQRSTVRHCFLYFLGCRQVSYLGCTSLKTCRSSVPHAASERILAHRSYIWDIIESVCRSLQGAADKVPKITRKLNQHLTDISFSGVIADLLYCSSVSLEITLILVNFTPHDLCPLPMAMSHEIL